MSNLLPKGLPTLKKTIFRVYSQLMLHSTMSKKNKFLIGALGMLLRQIVLISIPVFSGYFIENYSNNGYLAYALSILRLDVLFANMKYTQYYSLLQISIISINVLSKFSLILQFYYKKFWFISIPLTLAKFTSFLIYYIFQVPFSLYGFYVLGLLTGQQLGKSEYINNSSGDIILEVLVVFLTLLMHFILIWDLLLGNKPKFAEKTHFRAHSLVQVHEQFFLILISIVKMLADTEYFLYILIGGSLYLSICYYYYLPYFSRIYNTINLHTWLTVIYAAVLLIIGKKYENYHLLDFNLIFLYICSYYLSNEAIKKRIIIIKNQTYSDNAFIHELRIRYYLFDNCDSFDERKAKIFEHFQFASKHFFSFSLQYIWEAVIINKFIKDRDLVLLKLAKVNMSQYFKNKTLAGDVINDHQGYKYKIEAEFLMFVIFDRKYQIIDKKNNDLELVRFYNHFCDFKDMDYNLVKSLAEFTIKLTRKTSTKIFERELQNIGKQILEYKKAADLIHKKFGLEKDFSRLYGSMLKDILNIDEGMNILKQSNYTSQIELSLNREVAYFDKTCPVMIVSGCFNSIGTVVYANEAVYQLLSISETLKLIGTSFTEMIPPPFDVIHDKVLLRFLFYRNSSELTRSHLFLLNSQKNCIEVIMHFRLAFHKSYPFFIASFKPMYPAKNLILCSIDGLIYSVSEKVRIWFPDLQGNIYTSIPNIDKYLIENDYDKIFEYNEQGKILIMKKSMLSIDGYNLQIIYFIEKITDTSENLAVNKLRMEGYFTTMIQDGNQKSSKKNLNLDDDRKKSFYTGNSQMINALKYAKILSYSAKGLYLIQFIFAIIVLLIIYKLFSDLSFNSIIVEMGSMRFFSCSILANTQSLELIHKGLPVSNPSSFYKESIYNSSQELRNLLEKYKTISIPLLKIQKNYFKDKNVEIFKYLNGNFTRSKVTLFDAIEIVIKYSNTIANANIENFEKVIEERMFLLNNIPCKYIKALNDTIMLTEKDLQQSIDLMFEIMKYAELLCFIPSLLLIGISIVCLLKIEMTNKEIWKMIMKCPPEVIINARNKLTERLYYVHEYEFYSEKHSNIIFQLPYKFFSTKYFLKILFLLFITICYYFTINYSPQSLLLTAIKDELRNSNFGAMRRMLTPLTLFWTRDAILNEANLPSFISLVSNYEIPSSSLEMKYRISQFKWIEQDTMKFLTKLIQRGYSVSDYENLMLGNPCKILSTVDGCSLSLVSKGLDLGIKQYLDELEFYYIQVGITTNYCQGLELTEKYSFVIEKSLIYTVKVFSVFTSNMIKEANLYTILATFTYVAALVAYYAIVMHKTSEEVLISLRNKVEILSVFQESQK
ncbi:hypothetical protein SteCoe_1180 [Stentor coeruleus]|uniref:Uncharacterized protein n=1 Tax=Stentor coeruleus TaxID=5963 RepID=A0A1R2D2B9_9CILI|nr:hypothetical protein SteCoe_1180 [Stentor coeruleus]